MKKIFLLSVVIMTISAFCEMSLHADIIKALPNFLIKADVGAGTKINLENKNQASNSYFINNTDYSNLYNAHGRLSLALDPFFISNNEKIRKFELRITPQAKLSCLYNFVHNDFEINAGAYAACLEARGVYNVKDNIFNFIIAVKPEMNVYFSDCFGLDIAPFLEFSILEKEMYIGAELGVVFNPTRKYRNNFIRNYVNSQTTAFDNNGKNEFLTSMKQADILKGKSLQVTETEWGFEISNVDEKGKRICKENIMYTDNLDCICIVFKDNNEFFDFEKFAKKYVEDESEAYTIKNGNFIPAVATTYSLDFIDDVLVVSTKGKFSVCKVNLTKDKKLYLKLSDYSELSSSNVYELIEKPLEEKRRIEAEEKARAEIELKRERENKLKKYGFSSMEEWEAWKIRCSPTNLYRSLTIGAESSFIVGDITYIKEYTLSIRHLDVISGGYSYLISFPGLSKCCNVISMHQLSYMGGYDNLVSESMLLRFVGKGQYRQGYSIVDCDTFALVEEGTPDYNNFDKLMREIDF